MGRRARAHGSVVERSPEATGTWLEMYYVYVLKSLLNQRLYTGYSNNVEKRLEQHNSGKTKYTSHTGPYKLVYKETYSTRLEAARRERFLKSGKGRAFLKEVLKQ